MGDVFSDRKPTVDPRQKSLGRVMILIVASSVFKCIKINARPITKRYTRGAIHSSLFNNVFYISHEELETIMVLKAYENQKEPTSQTPTIIIIIPIIFTDKSNLSNFSFNTFGLNFFKIRE